MDKPLIPDLKDQLKKMVINFIKKYKYDVVYIYKIIFDNQYSISKASLNYIYKVIDKSGDYKYYLHNTIGRTEIMPISEKVNELCSGSTLGWNELSKLFKYGRMSLVPPASQNYYKDRLFYGISPSLEDEAFLEKLLDKVIYTLHGSNIIRNLTELREIIGCELDYFEFAGLEYMENIPIKIRVNGLDLKKECKLSFDIAPEYINNFLPGVQKNRRLYKDEGYYNKKKFITTTLASKFLIITDYEFWMHGDGIPDEFVDELSDFVQDDGTFVMQTDTDFNNDDAINLIDSHYFTGMKIYKIPQAPFNWQPVLKNIENKLIELNSKNGFVNENEIKYVMDNYRYFAIYNMSFECSPDNYLEIYATKEALELFFLPGIKDGLESLDAVYPMTSIKFVHIVDHYKDLYHPLFQVTIYKHHFGSGKNRFYNDNFVFDYD